MLPARPEGPSVAASDSAQVEVYCCFKVGLSFSPRAAHFYILPIRDMKTYRTLVLKYRVEKLQPEAAEKVAQLPKAQVEFRRWAEEWARSNGKTPLPEQRPLKYFAVEFLHAAGVRRPAAAGQRTRREQRRSRRPAETGGQNKEVERKHHRASAVEEKRRVD